MARIGISMGSDAINNNPSFLSTQFCVLNPFLSISNHAKKRPRKFSSVSIASSNLSLFSPPQRGVSMPGFNAKDAVFSSENIDSLMRKSVSDIVKRLEEAPLLVQVYSESGRSECKIERASSERWPMVKSEWENGKLKSPKGIIFVKQLDQENEEESFTKAWGVVVQHKGKGCGSACYLLQTSRVCGGIGLGFCTHFCLIKVRNFRDSAFQQFSDSWCLQ
ncbi:uncharacterized protein [Henckelia pumila]|uniref:uncharacterized protein n=1 Tax=Henckelia pumila TaxID=405737 RepID=UPI003C6DC9A7